MWSKVPYVDGLKGLGLRMRGTYLDMLYFLKRQVLTDQVSQSIFVDSKKSMKSKCVNDYKIWMTIKSE